MIEKKKQRYRLGGMYIPIVLVHNCPFKRPACLCFLYPWCAILFPDSDENIVINLLV
jgi:hypothetical protein